ncbi:aldehyde dehydrogenase family protein [Sinorhizobium meliloti]|jgi:succinate-semialdehyde dehydrogenase / glutarate-semialdehyde dehydrogenase|uniref:Aldehyde dehydrogenase family protein n=1 Tax=Rhizobium meliloti TaxID=382 RepID=A0AAW9TR23_RHIML|nr:NAD-dependent succinate-semialdehyde dehydrogenase [Sinorhizobium meliloti]ASJ62759.1 NAD-dependent succinate-semialdehyde dehydrogenase [Sinorhizobium meliloti]ASQ07220.1 NAD-dependent succinate-semialdehyde dehydrogenase [Sinorhizobium meliloti]MCK3786102.1 NAD-dependent succinate-semialdehyde dehydrogenase [Sinorhizobium meliloti]MCK3792385.1 NAD-dependent succinate-semialdehyde dehydrogenase [Sinorhizobium meliloti]MCK3798292.1 NAD-dependent succinate-semialdehyde dehydrogenase [Sinorhi
MNPETTAVPYERLGILIDGRWIYEAERSTEVVDPATGQTIARLPFAADGEIAEAVASSQRAFESWKDRSPLERGRILRRFADLARKHADEIARNMTRDQGKPLSEAIGEIRFAADHADWHAEEARRIYGRVIPARDPRVQQMVLREPVGVCIAFTPWNFPFSQALRKVVAALASGCTIILKGPGESPSSTVAIGRLMQEAGLPDGCLNILWGDPAHLSETLLAAPEVRKISFTGSVEVGKHLASLAGRHMKRSTMELGGHAPVILFDDADIEAAADALAGQKVRNAGQVCISPTRFYVQAKGHDRFLARFAEKIASTRVGNGFQESVQMGPLCHGRRVAEMEGFVQDAREQGAEIVTGGERVGNAGFFYAPTVVAAGTDELRLMKEEPFGPIAVVTPFGDFDEVIRRANSLPFGLASYVFTGSSSRAQNAARALAAGMVSVNHFGLALPETPFGGINDSGYGSEGGSETFDGYLNTKFVTRFDQIPQ